MGNDWFHEYFINELKAIGRKPTSNMQYEVVDSLPSSGNEQTIYFVKNDSSSSNNHYDEYVWISSSSAFEKIGSTQIDGSTTQPDWNQNDNTQPDYIKNRPFYTGDPAEAVLVEETTIPFEAGNGGFYVGLFETTFSPTVGETYKVSWDGSVYESTCLEFSKPLTIGNLSIMGEGSDTGEPFLFVKEGSEGLVIVTADTSASHTISISCITIPVVKIDPKYLDQSDWDQNDVAAPSYIKNRPFYTGDPVETVFVEESVITFKDSGEGLYLAQFELTFVPTVGETYKVSWDGSVYESTCLEFSKALTIGNLSIMGEGSDTGEPFLMVIKNGQFASDRNGIDIHTLDTSASHTISISGRTTQVVKIDEKYLPDTVAAKSDVEVAQTTAENAQTTANAAKTTAENAQTTANAAKSTAETAKSKVEKALTVESSGNILAPVASMIKGTYQKLYLSSEDSKVQSSFGVTGSTGLQITVGRDGGFNAPVSNPSTVEFISNGGRYMCLKGIDELILNSSTSGSTKKFKITVDDTGTISATEVT